MSRSATRPALAGALAAGDDRRPEAAAPTPSGPVRDSDESRDDPDHDPSCVLSRICLIVYQ